ncbi:hypothetical protein [Marimonas lutisalis]|uniref:hypothetical protein n=1 Tax=Marimonas lutisalis TaxID=2545756 RepID=UPI0010F87233|nr:hypothetical protein [Marimonas lutisalis]
MDQNGTYDKSASKRAFQRGMMLALGIALVPVMIVSTGLFLSGYQPGDFDANMRYILLGLWIGFLVTVNRLSNLNLGRLYERIPSDQRGQVLTIVVFSALLGALRLRADMTALEMARNWFIGFFVLALLFLGLFTLFAAVHGSWKRARQRSRDKRRH